MELNRSCFKRNPFSVRNEFEKNLSPASNTWHRHQINSVKFY